MGGAMKYFQKKLLGHEIFRSMVSLATKNFLQSPPLPRPPSYILNVRSLRLHEAMQEKLKTVSYSEQIKILTLGPDKWSQMYC